MAVRKLHMPVCPLTAARIPVCKYLFAIVACKYKVDIWSRAGFFDRPLLNLELISKIGVCHHAGFW